MLISISLQFLNNIILQTQTPFLFQLEGLGLVCRAQGRCKRPRKSGGEEGPSMGIECLRWVWRVLGGWGGTGTNLEGWWWGKVMVGEGDGGGRWWWGNVMVGEGDGGGRWWWGKVMVECHFPHIRTHWSYTYTGQTIRQPSTGYVWNSFLTFQAQMAVVGYWKMNSCRSSGWSYLVHQRLFWNLYIATAKNLSVTRAAVHA